MVINALRNKRCGPGGSTRRLHQNLLPFQQFGWRQADLILGAKQDRRACKGLVFARYDTAVIGSFLQMPMTMNWPLLPNY